MNLKNIEQGKIELLDLSTNSLLEYDIDKLINSNIEELASIPDIGDIIAQSIIDYFNNEKNIKLINRF